MKVNLYDFDNTIYHGDSSVDFFLFCLRKKPKMLFLLPKMGSSFIKYRLHITDKTAMKETIFSYLKYFDNIDDLVGRFWLKHRSKIKEFFLNKDHAQDIIISASPEFLLRPMADSFNIRDLIASIVDKKTGHFQMPNCHGEEKVRRLKAKYPEIEVLEAYSDSMSDLPILTLAEKAYKVKGFKISPLNLKK